jgi:chitodextrinase
MTTTPCIRPEDHPVPILAWVSPLVYSFGHQVADDAKTGSGTTEKHANQGFLGEMAGEPGFSHDFKGLIK